MEAEVHDLFVGTWVGIAVIAEALIEAGLIKRKALIRPLSAAEAVKENDGGESLRELQLLIEGRSPLG
jgi:hypothetical protein